MSLLLTAAQTSRDGIGASKHLLPYKRAVCLLYLMSQICTSPHPGYNGVDITAPLASFLQFYLASFSSSSCLYVLGKAFHPLRSSGDVRSPGLLTVPCVYGRDNKGREQWNWLGWGGADLAASVKPPPPSPGTGDGAVFTQGRWGPENSQQHHLMDFISPLGF